MSKFCQDSSILYPAFHRSNDSSLNYLLVSALPNDPNNPLLTRIEEKYGLYLSEVSMLMTMANTTVLPSLKSATGKVKQNGLPFAGLPNDRSDPLRTEIRTECGLSLPEISFLTNASTGTTSNGNCLHLFTRHKFEFEFAFASSACYSNDISMFANNADYFSKHPSINSALHNDYEFLSID